MLNYNISSKKLLFIYVPILIVQLVTITVSINILDPNLSALSGDVEASLKIGLIEFGIFTPIFVVIAFYLIKNFKVAEKTLTKALIFSFIIVILLQHLLPAVVFVIRAVF